MLATARYASRMPSNWLDILQSIGTSVAILVAMVPVAVWCTKKYRARQVEREIVRILQGKSKDDKILRASELARHFACTENEICKIAKASKKLSTGPDVKPKETLIRLKSL